MWKETTAYGHIKDDERSFVTDRFKPKSSFNPRNEEVIIEIYLNCLEERSLDIEIPSKRISNLKWTLLLPLKMLTRVLLWLFQTERII